MIGWKIGPIIEEIYSKDHQITIIKHHLGQVTGDSVGVLFTISKFTPGTIIITESFVGIPNKYGNVSTFILPARNPTPLEVLMLRKGKIEPDFFIQDEVYNTGRVASRFVFYAPEIVSILQSPPNKVEMASPGTIRIMVRNKKNEHVPIYKFDGQFELEPLIDLYAVKIANAFNMVLKILPFYRVTYGWFDLS